MILTFMTKHSRILMKMSVKKDELGNHVSFRKLEGPSLDYWQKVKAIKKTLAGVETKYLDMLEEYCGEPVATAEA